MPDLFFDLFTKEFLKVKDKIGTVARRDEGTYLTKLLESVKPDDVWRELRLYSRRDDYIVAAVDGGIRTIPLSDGTEILIARALAVNNYGAQPIRTLITEYLPVPSGAAYWTYLGLVELETCKKCVIEQLSKFERRDKYLLIDGSLYARLIATIHNLILTRGFLDLYYIPEIMLSLIRLAELLELCKEHEVKPIFVSKNSSLKILKDHIIFTLLKDAVKDSITLSVDPEIFEIFTKGAEWYSIVWLRKYRKKLVELAGKYSGSNKELVKYGIRTVIAQSITDTCILEHIAQMNSITCAISRKLLLGAVDAYLNDRKLTNPDALYKVIQDRVEDCIMLRMSPEEEAEHYRDLARRVRDLLGKLPRILLTYIKLRKDDTPILVEIPVQKWRFFDETIPPKIFYDSFNMWDIIELLYSEYKDPYHYNRMLWLAHNYVHFSENELQEYTMSIMKMLDKIRGRRLRTLLVSAYE